MRVRKRERALERERRRGREGDGPIVSSALPVRLYERANGSPASMRNPGGNAVTFVLSASLKRKR